MRPLAFTGLVALVATCAAVAVVGTPGASATVTPGVKPDLVLTPHAAPTIKNISGVLINDASVQAKGNTAFTDFLADEFVVPTPDECRTPAYDTVCDVYRVKLNRSTAPGARNYVVVQIEWSGTRLPDLALVAAGLGLGYLPDLDMFLYANPKHYMDYTEIGGRGVAIPERIGWTATQDEYDVIVRSGTGVSTGYKLVAYMTDEIFDKPFEVLDQVLSAAPPPDHSGDQSGAATPSLNLPESTPPLDLAPVDTDEQIAGIGLGTAEQFDPQALNLGHQTRNIAAKTEPPSTLALVVGMLGLPLAAGAAVVVVLRRRRQAFIA